VATDSGSAPPAAPRLTRLGASGSISRALDPGKGEEEGVVRSSRRVAEEVPEVGPLPGVVRDEAFELARASFKVPGPVRRRSSRLSPVPGSTSKIARRFGSVRAQKLGAFDAGVDGDRYIGKCPSQL